MKIKKAKESTFEPVTITIESQEELDFFTEVFVRVGGQRAVDLFESTSTIPRKLQEMGGKRTHTSEGDVHIN